MRSLENRCENRCNFDTLSKYVSRNIYFVSSKNFFPPVVKKRKKKKRREDLKMEGRKGRGAEKAVKRKTVEIIWPRFHASGASSVAAIPPQI